MRAITKGAEPASLTAHRQTQRCDYDNYADKATLRQALVTDQRGICCYCMGRIRNGSATMKIEHWRCQSCYPDEQLNYRNLLGACLGGNGQPPHLQHCDTRKGVIDAILNWWKHEKERLRGPVPRGRFEAEHNRRITGEGELRTLLSGRGLVTGTATGEDADMRDIRLFEYASKAAMNRHLLQNGYVSVFAENFDHERTT